MENQLLEELQIARNLVVSLAKEIDVKNKKLWEMEYKCDETSATLSKMMVENTRLHHAYGEGMKKMQFTSQYNEKMQQNLESLRNEIEQKLKEFEKSEAKHDLDRKNLLLEKGKLKAQSSTETNYILNTQMDYLRKDLAEKVDELQCMDELTQTLILRERMSNLELQDARKELINGPEDVWKSQTAVGIKRMGEVDPKPFSDVCKQKLSEDWEVKSIEICSLWQQHVKNPMWHPFKRELVEGKYQEIIDEDDRKLKELRSAWGEAAFKAVVNALLELNEYNPSGRYAVSELWNFKEGKRASLKEAVKYLIQELKNNKSLKRGR